MVRGPRGVVWGVVPAIVETFGNSTLYCRNRFSGSTDFFRGPTLHCRRGWGGRGPRGVMWYIAECQGTLASRVARSSTVAWEAPMVTSTG